MQLNPDCVRDVLLKIEDLHCVFVNDDGYIEKESLWIESLYSALPDYRKEDIFYSLYNLDQAGYVDISMQWINGTVSKCIVNHMTYTGHEFLNNIRDSSNWKTINKGLTAIRNYSLSAISAIAEGVTSAAISAYLAENQ